MLKNFVLSIISTVLIIAILIGFFLLSFKTKQENPSKTTIVSQNSPTPKITEKFLIRGSIAYWDQAQGVASFEKNVSSINYISLFWYYLTSDGRIQKYQYAMIDNSVIEFAHQNNSKVLVTITNLPETGDWDSDRVKRLISSPEQRSKHIGDIVALVDSQSFDGVSIDYESLDVSQKNNFSQFIKELYFSLHNQGKIVSVSLHPKTGEGKPSEDNGSRAQDWKELAKYADQLFLMTYDQHWDTSEAGAVASLQWIKNVVNYAIQLNLPQNKIFLGVPLYGYDWNKDTNDAATGLSYQDTEKLIQIYNPKVIYDKTLASPHFSYINNGDKHEVWFEDVKSVKAKLDTVVSDNLAGVAFWRLGEEDPQIWKLLKKPM